MIGLPPLFLAACTGLVATFTELPSVAIVIDDIGYQYENGRAAVELPHSFGYAVLPFSPHSRSLAELANDLGKDVLVHLPMEAEQDNHLLGPGALRVEMSLDQFEKTLVDSIRSVPHAIGINNHMGSRLTREPRQMRWLMHAIQQNGGLFFIDSRTTAGSVALRAAKEANIETAARNVFLDNVQSRSEIEGQIDDLVALAYANGHALGIAHPHPITIKVLENWQPAGAGVRLVKVSDYVARTKRAAATIAAHPSAPSAGTSAECGNQRDGAEPTQYPDVPG